MEQVVVGILMLISFISGAFIRDPFIHFGKKEKDQMNTMALPSVEPKKEDKKEDKPDERYKKLQEQVEALWNYNESDGLNKHD